MAYCPSCGSVVNKYAKYCESCGDKLAIPKSNGEYSPQKRETALSEKGREWKTHMFCDGTGKHPGDGNVLPPAIDHLCNGKGRVLLPKNTEPCRGPCKGAGKIDISGGLPPKNFKPCSVCGGTGWS